MAGGASGRSRWPDPRTPNEVERRGDPARPLTRPPLLNPANIHVGAPSRVAECGAQADQAARHTSTNGYLAYPPSNLKVHKLSSVTPLHPWRSAVR